jgi:O-antigen/teichoic acid export membrane protein
MIDKTENTTWLKEKFLKKWFWLYFFSLLSAPIWYIIKIIISGQLSVEDIWIIYWIISLLTLLSSLNDFWFTESFKYFIPKYLEEKRLDKAKTVLFLWASAQIITSIIIFLIIFFSSNFIWLNYFSSPIAWEVLKIFSLFFILINIFQISTTFFSAIQNTFLEKWVMFLRSIFNLTFVIYLLFIDNVTLNSVSYVFVIWLFLTTIISSIIFWTKYYKKHFKNQKLFCNKKFISSIFKYSIVALFSAQVWTLLSQVDTQMVIYILWTKDAWYYSNYLSLVTLPFLLIWPLLWFLLPVFSGLNANNNREDIYKVKNSLFKYFWIISISAWFFLLWLSQNFAYIFFWEKFLPSWNILLYSSMFLVFNFLLQINFAVLWWIWKVRDRAEILSYALLLNIITNIIFIKIFWVWWAALATGLWWIFIFFFSEKKLKKDNLHLKSCPTYFLKTFLAWIILALILSQINLLDLSRLKALWALFIIFIVYLFIMIIINKSDAKNFITEIKKIRQKK